MLRALGPMSPRRIGPYTVLARLGGGGMGDVYLGCREGQFAPETLVAVKTIRPDLADVPAFRERFRRETELIGTVSSPCIAMRVAADTAADPPWLATRYVAGPTLGAALRRGGPLPEHAVRALGSDLARALGALHAVGIVHRDVKPGNVLLDHDRALLIDLGLARTPGDTTGEGDVLLGTPDFMSPEQLRNSRVTARSDVFSLGALLCFAATGSKPFGSGPPAAVQHRIAAGTPVLDAVPDGLRSVIERCLDPVPDRRPRPEELAEWWSADAQRAGWPAPVREHVEEYRRAARDVRTRAEPLPPPAEENETAGPSRRTAWNRRRSRRAALAAALALLAAAGIWLWPAGPEPDGTGTAPARAGELAQPAGVDDRGTADSSRVVPPGPRGTPAGWRPWRARLAGPAMGCAAGTEVLVCRLTDGTYTALDPARGRTLWTIGRYDPDTYPSISPTGYTVYPARSTQPTVHGRYAVLSTDGWLQVREARTGKVRWERESSGALAVRSRPLVGDGMVFVATSRKKAVSGATPHLAMTAFALDDGRKLWTKALSTEELARAHMRDFEPVAYADGLVYALSNGGLVSYDGRTGAARGRVGLEAEECDVLAVAGRTAFCSHQQDQGAGPLILHRLDATTLQPAGRPVVPEGPPLGGLARLAAVDDRVAAFLDPGSGTMQEEEGEANPAVSLFDPRTGAARGRFPLPPGVSSYTGPSGRGQEVTDPMIIGDALVYADHSALHVVPLTADGRPGRERVVPVEGAPGPRREEQYDRSVGTNLAREIRPPVMIPLGNALLIVYDKGTVVSVPLPE